MRPFLIAVPTALLLAGPAWTAAFATTPAPAATASSAPPTSGPSPSPSPSPAPTPTPAATPQSTGVLSLQPALGAPGTTITIQGSGFRKGEQGTLYWDSPSSPFGPFTADGAGTFRLDVKAPAGEPGQHLICPLLPGPAQGCVQFKLEAPAPSPSASPSPTAIATPAATPGPAESTTPGPAGADRPVAVAALLRPPFVLFPILLLLALLGGCGLWIWAGRRRPAAPLATVVHRSGAQRAVRPPDAPRPAGPPPPADLPAPRQASEGSLDLPEPGD